jgi:hypothetical protein
VGVADVHLDLAGRCTPGPQRILFTWNRLRQAQDHTLAIVEENHAEKPAEDFFASTSARPTRPLKIGFAQAVRAYDGPGASSSHARYGKSHRRTRTVVDATLSAAVAALNLADGLLPLSRPITTRRRCGKD